ncbi:MAG: hypothetical protein EP334_00815 [Gammaproteobacteria bacterium]|nr:MAG: hypothetical protein EP334_00815 [Gammaproteobacteria bacterium]
MSTKNISKKNLKPLAAAVGAAFMASVAIAPLASASENPFQANELRSGYNLADSHGEGKCGEGRCGEAKKAAKEGKCGEGKCGEEKKAAKEGKCGEGKAKEGNCGENKPKAKEGKCGEGKCGGNG